MSQSKTWADRVIPLLADRYDDQLIEAQIPFVSGRGLTPKEAALDIAIRFGEPVNDARQRFGVWS